MDLNKIDFSPETGKVKKLDLGPDQTNTFSGMVNDQFKETEPFTFLGL
jgi:choloylglycine hydrolase